MHQSFLKNIIIKSLIKHASRDSLDENTTKVSKDEGFFGFLIEALKLNRCFWVLLFIEPLQLLLN